MHLFIVLILFVLIKSEADNECETGKDVNEFKDCKGKSVKPDNYCCFIHLSYLGPHAKYCFEFPKKDIDNNRIKQTINLIQDGQYWFMRIQSYDIHSLECDHSFKIKNNFWYYIIYIYLLITFL